MPGQFGILVNRPALSRRPFALASRADRSSISPSCGGCCVAAERRCGDDRGAALGCGRDPDRFAWMPFTTAGWRKMVARLGVKLEALREAARARNIEFSIHRVAKGEEIAAAVDSAQAP